MVQQYSPNFPHRHNADGTCDSICTLCFQTVARSRIETDLSRHERNHKCDPDVLYQVGVGRIAYPRTLPRWA